MAMNNPVAIATVGGFVVVYQAVTLMRPEAPSGGMALLFHIGVLLAGVACLVGGILRLLNRRR